MSNPAPPGKSSPPPPRELQPLPGLLSFLVPGLGQIYQGRTSKGLLFFVCIYGLFFYGMYLGAGTAVAGSTSPTTYTVSGNVYLTPMHGKNAPFDGLPHFLNDLYNRPQYLGQFWVGVVAWPAMVQYATGDDEAKESHPILGRFEQMPLRLKRPDNGYDDVALNAVNTYGDKLLELGWVYTVIAGVLNIMVIYDALAGPAFLSRKTDLPKKATA